MFPAGRLNIPPPEDWPRLMDEDCGAGRGASHIVHFSLAEPGFWSEQREQVHDASELGLYDGICDMVNDGVLLVGVVGVMTNEKVSTGLANAAFLAASDALARAIEIWKRYFGRESTGFLAARC